MRAIERFYESINHDQNWMNVLQGNNTYSIDGTVEHSPIGNKYGGFFRVTIETLRKQLREDGFYTKVDGSGDVLYIARKPFKYFN
jgi:hypothetical protein